MSKEWGIARVGDVPAQHFGQDPKDVAVSFLRDKLGAELGAVSHMKLGPGVISNAHKHKKQEEIYVLISGQVQMKLDEDVIDLKPMDFVRVGKDTIRAVLNTGKGDAILIVFGAPNTGPGDGIDVDNFWNQLIE